MEQKYTAPMRKFPFDKEQIKKADKKITDILCRANLFANDKDLQ